MSKKVDPRITQRNATVTFGISELASIMVKNGRGELFGRPPGHVSDFEASQYEVKNIKEVEKFLNDRGISVENFNFETVLAYAKKREIQRQINLSVRNYVFNTLDNFNEESVQYRGYLSTGGQIDVDVKVNIEAELVNGEIDLHVLNPHHLVNSWFKRGFYKEDIPADLWISNKEFKGVFLSVLPRLIGENDFTKADLGDIEINIDPHKFYEEFYKTVNVQEMRA